MKYILGLFGILLLLDCLIGVVLVFTGGDVSGKAIGQQLDEDFVTLTTGLCAIALAQLLFQKAKS